MADMNQFVDKDYEGMDFQELADCPVEAVQGLSQGDAEKLKDAFNVRPSRTWPRTSSSA